MLKEYALIPQAVLEDLKKIRNRNPLAKHGAENTNAVFVEIGKNLVVDYILDMYEVAKGVRKGTTVVQSTAGSDYTSELTKE
ncbi:MAG: hypothetical protein MJZ20_02945 [Bacteroidaceae bacterium]|nr:hypothetical protein [Bacteroidaceae bacterium]